MRVPARVASVLPDDPRGGDYHARQHAEPYRATVHFCDWLESEGAWAASSGRGVLEVACGMGANLAYMGRRHPDVPFVGFDLEPALVGGAADLLSSGGPPNCRVEVGDLYDMGGYRDRFDGVVAFQVLPCLRDAEEGLLALLGVGAEWVATTALIHDGAVSARIRTRDHSRPVDGHDWHDTFYNILSLDHVRGLCAAQGYADVRSVPFQIDLDLPRPEHGGMGTHTVPLSDGDRLQLSGPLLMPWRFLLARRG